jgi:hypothetical protein
MLLILLRKIIVNAFGRFAYLPGRGNEMTIGRTAVLVLALAVWPAAAQKTQKSTAALEPAQQQFAAIDQPNAEQTKREFDQLLSHYPPTVRGVFKQDPTLMAQQQYLAPYPALANFLTAHPEIALNPSYYLDGLGGNPWDRPRDVLNMWDDFEKFVFILCGFSVAIGLLTWLIRTFLDYRRWNRLSKVQTEVHTRLLDRFSTNEEVMAYIATPAGSKFLQSAPISLDTGTSSRSMGAPLSRIMWSLQAGLVLAAAGIGLMVASQTIVERDASDPLHVFGVLAIALGAGFAVSAAVSYLLSQKLGLLDQAPQKRHAETPEAQ